MDSTPNPDQLVKQMNSGSLEEARAAAAAFVMAHGPLIRARARRNLTPRMRRQMDSQDLLHTVARRLDRAIVNGTFSGNSSQNVLGYISKILDNACMDKWQVIRRYETVEGPDSELAIAMLRRIKAGDADVSTGVVDISRLLQAIAEEDAELVVLHARGMSYKAMAQLLSVKPAALRTRWSRLRPELLEKLDAHT